MLIATNYGSLPGLGKLNGKGRRPTIDKSDRNTITARSEGGTSRPRAAEQVGTQPKGKGKVR